MGKIFFKEKDLVVPGDILAEGIDYLPSGGCIRENDNIIANHLGLVILDNRFVKVIPLAGKYVPKVGDTVIGYVADMSFNGWFFDINGPYEAALMVKDVAEFIDKDMDLAQFYNFGDLVITQVSRVTRYSNINLTTKGPGLRKITGGKVIAITPTKVPRVIGKQGSMVQMLKEKTNCNIIVGQNGLVWVEGKNPNDELMATEAILKIEHESHIDGLTDKMKEFLEEKR